MHSPPLRGLPCTCSNHHLLSLPLSDFSLIWRWWIHRVSGNPVCLAGNIARPALCDKAFAGKQVWTSPYSPSTNCPTLTCSENRVINPLLPGNCNCTQPLKIQLEARRPAFSAITDELMETLRGQLAQQLNLRMTQVWIATAALTADGRAELNVDFFNADGVSPLDGTTTLNVTHSLTSNFLALPSVKPYLARVLVDVSTFCKPGSLSPLSFLLSSGTSRNGTCHIIRLIHWRLVSDASRVVVTCYVGVLVQWPQTRRA